MKTFSFLLLKFSLLLMLAAGSITAYAQSDVTQNAKPVKLSDVREEALKRAKAARDLRAELAKSGNSISGIATEQLVNMDRENNSWLKSVVEKYGWLGTSLVGEDGEAAAFLLARLAMQDRSLQKKCLELLQEAVKNGEAPAAQPDSLAKQMSMIVGGTAALPPGASVKYGDGVQMKTTQTSLSVKYPELREQLLKRMVDDQRVRTDLQKKYNGTFTPAAFEEMKKIDEENTAWIKPLIKQYGWLGKSSVGADGATAAFLIIQHAPDDEFQKNSLELLRKAYRDGEASGDQYALMTDRARMKEGKPQIYGTQTRITKDGKFEMLPIEDEANVDQRRAAVGLGPLAEYVERMRQMYQKRKSE